MQITAVKDDDVNDFTNDHSYTVKKDSDGDLYIDDDLDYSQYIHQCGDYECDVMYRFLDGTFRIEKAADIYYLSIDDIAQEDNPDGSRIFYAKVRMDEDGLEKLRDAATESEKGRQLAELLRKKKELENQIAKLQEAN